MVPRTNQNYPQTPRQKDSNQRLERTQLFPSKGETVTFLSNSYFSQVEGSCKGLTSLKTVGRDWLLVHLIIRHFFVFLSLESGSTEHARYWVHATPTIACTVSLIKEVSLFQRLFSTLFYMCHVAGTTGNVLIREVSLISPFDSWSMLGNAR